jgi:hypothetical protein
MRNRDQLPALFGADPRRHSTGQARDVFPDVAGLIVLVFRRPQAVDMDAAAPADLRIGVGRYMTRAIVFGCQIACRLANESAVALAGFAWDDDAEIRIVRKRPRDFERPGAVALLAVDQNFRRTI